MSKETWDSNENRESIGGFDDLREIDAAELLDLKEEEEKKIGFSTPKNPPEATEDRAKDGKGSEKLSAGELVRREEERELPLKEEKLTGHREPQNEANDAAESEQSEELSREEPRLAPRKVGWRRVALASVFPLLTVLLAAGVMLAALSVTREGGGLPQEEETSEPSSSAEKESGRVVFVKQYDDESGILTIPELYARYSECVVSIIGEGENGTGIGSGFFLTEDGYIATANHVIEGMEKLTVVRSDGTPYPARLVAGNALTDLALLKIEGEDFPAALIGSSGELLTGDRVVAIGTPASLDYAGSVSSGDVSYLSRRVKIYGAEGILEKKMTLIQTNTPVNPGNSGCPLFNEYGEVIGIITMKLSRDYAGIGFAIPTDGAMPILREMMAGNEPSDVLLSRVSTYAPRLGILGERGKEGEILGVRVVGFSPEYGMAASILQEGDLIIGVDGVPVADGSDVAAVISEKNPTETVSVTVLRGGQRLTFRLTLGK